MQSELAKFNPLSVSSKFAICGLPLRVDTYKTCTHDCRYCFSNDRKIMESRNILQVGDIEWLERKLKKVAEDQVNPSNFLDKLLQDKITWHCGGMSDPFQPCEGKFGITRQLVDLATSYGHSILFSTKGFSTYGANIRSDLHTFQFSFTSSGDRPDLEPGIASFETRYKLYRELKDKGFRCGIRVQPFIPGITDTNLVDVFHDADYFSLEGLKLVPQNEAHKEALWGATGLKSEDFLQRGLLTLRPELRWAAYTPFMARLDELKIPYSLADNDLHHVSCSACCCGSVLTTKTTTFNNTAMCHKYGSEYTLDQLKQELSEYAMCQANQFFTSNRQEGCKTVEEFYAKRFGRPTSPFSPKFLDRESTSAQIFGLV